ncbi:MAG: hypothetical protein ACOYLC_15310 [Armatimonadaceae bacterium]|jgi:hypothetical protein
MSVRELRITKRLTQVQGKTKPACEARAIIPASESVVLLEHFGNEPLFKRTAYAGGFTDGGYKPTPALSKMLANFVKNDACPEVLVKTLINGQRFEANTFWDILCFEFIAKVSFDSLLILCEGTRALNKTLVYHGIVAEADVAAFEEDDARERSQIEATELAAAQAAETAASEAAAAETAKALADAA